MALSPENLREIDRSLLELLDEGRVTPVYARERMAEDGHHMVTSTYIGQRLQRLEEHGHAENLFDTGLYELVSDPRTDDGTDA